MKGMKILVTGADMLGCYTARELSQEGHEVTLFELSPVLSYIQNVVDLKRVKLVRGDVLNVPDLMHAIKESGAERIVHTAALLGASVNKAPYTAIKVNVQGTANVLEAAQLSGVNRVVYTSTGGVYKRMSTAPMKEDHFLESSSVYNASKLGAEQIGLQYSQLLKIKFVVLRYGVGYGPAFSAQGSIYAGVIQELITKSAKGQPVTIQRTAPFMKSNDLIYVKDMAHATALAVKAEALKDNVFNIGSGTLIDLAELATVVRKLIPNADIKIEEPSGSPKKDPYLFPMDISRAQEQLGYKQMYPPLEGIKDYLASV